MWDTAKARLRGKFVVLNVYIRNEERSKIKNLSFHFRIVEKEQMMPTASRIKGIIKNREKIDNTKKEKINETKIWFFERSIKGTKF